MIFYDLGRGDRFIETLKYAVLLAAVVAALAILSGAALAATRRDTE